MSVVSYTFGLFVLIVLVVYHILPGRPRIYWLLAASYLFYATWSWRFLVVLLAVTVVNFYLGSLIQPGNQNGNRSPLLWIGIGVNVAALFFMRSGEFFVPEAVQLLNRFGIDADAGSLRILLPVGLSFIIVQLISYLVDVYRGQLPSLPTFAGFALYLAYFPKLVAGPIVRAQSFLPRMLQPSKIDNEALSRSLTLIVIGLVRKVVIADQLMHFIPNGIFEHPEQQYAVNLFYGLIAYGFMLYNDFAGYTNIACGVSGLFGIELPSNFEHPYFARNFNEFWDRWHITLSHWLRDYIFFPVSRALGKTIPSRRHAANVVVPPLATMLVSALWHGATLNMLLWGALHGVYLIIGRIMSLRGPAIPPHKKPWWKQVMSASLVFALASLAWVPFRTDMSSTVHFWGAMILNWPGLWLPQTGLIVLVVLCLILDWQEYHRGQFAFLKWPALSQATALAVSVLLVLIFSSTKTAATTFIYQGF